MYLLFSYNMNVHSHNSWEWRILLEIWLFTTRNDIFQAEPRSQDLLHFSPKKLKTLTWPEALKFAQKVVVPVCMGVGGAGGGGDVEFSGFLGHSAVDSELIRRCWRVSRWNFIITMSSAEREAAEVLMSGGECRHGGRGKQRRLTNPQHPSPTDPAGGPLQTPKSSTYGMF